MIDSTPKDASRAFGGNRATAQWMVGNTKEINTIMDIRL